MFLWFIANKVTYNLTSSLLEYLECILSLALGWLLIVLIVLFSWSNLGSALLLSNEFWLMLILVLMNLTGETTYSNGLGFICEFLIEFTPVLAKLFVEKSRFFLFYSSWACLMFSTMLDCSPVLAGENYCFKLRFLFA